MIQNTSWNSELKAVGEQCAEIAIHQSCIIPSNVYSRIVTPVDTYD
jgi:hypothetical protein